MTVLKQFTPNTITNSGSTCFIGATILPKLFANVILFPFHPFLANFSFHLSVFPLPIFSNSQFYPKERLLSLITAKFAVYSEILLPVVFVVSVVVDVVSGWFIKWAVWPRIHKMFVRITIMIANVYDFIRTWKPMIRSDTLR